MFIATIKIVFYKTTSGHCPFSEWFISLETETKERINQRLERLSHGNFGDYKNLGNEIFELRFHFGPGYRVYFGKENNKIIILLNGGNKDKQSQDIKKAKIFYA